VKINIWGKESQNRELSQLDLGELIGCKQLILLVRSSS
jgi:hypothetical protein